MGAKALESADVDKVAAAASPQRTCIVTRAILEPDELIRFVCGPDGSIVADLARKLPGRGVWVACHRSVVAEAVRRNAFSRALKRKVYAADTLAAEVEGLMVRRTIAALSLANKAGLVIPGFTKVELAIGRERLTALIHAADAADGGTAKLDRKFQTAEQLEGVPNVGGGTRCPVTDLTVTELSLAIGRSNVVHAALAEGGAAKNFLKEAGRLRRYRSHAVEAATPLPQSGFDTGQV